MRTFEYRLFVNKAQSRKLMACLAESRTIYNGMLETVKRGLQPLALTGNRATRRQGNPLQDGQTTVDGVER